MTSTSNGFSSGVMVRSILKRPSTSGIASLPFTLTVASGDVRPDRVKVSVPTVWSSGGNVTCNFNSAVCGTGVGPGVAVGGGCGVEVGGGGGGNVAVGTGVAVGIAVVVGTMVGAAAGLGMAVAAGDGVALWEGSNGVAGAVGVVDVVEVGGGGACTVGVRVASCSPQAVLKAARANRITAAGIHLAGKIRTVIPSLP